MYCLTITPKVKVWKRKLLNDKSFRPHRKLITEPCYEHDSGYKEWWHNGNRHEIVETEFSIEIKSFVFSQTKVEYKLNSIADHPSVIYNNGTKEWHCFGFLSRTFVYDAPSIVYSNGDKEWWQHGKRHRLRINGPAVIYGNKQYWYEDGEFKKCIV